MITATGKWLRYSRINSLLWIWVSISAVVNAQTPAVSPVPTEVLGAASTGLHLYPLGWSSEGRWGALIGREEKIQVVVIDTVTDDILLESRSVSWSGPKTINQFWKARSSEIWTILNSYGIESSRITDIREAEFITGGVKYAFELKPSSPASGHYTVEISSSRGDKKAVYSSRDKTPPERTRLAAAVLSPFEERALAVLIEQNKSGKELSYRFIGAHLTLGFASTQSKTTPVSKTPPGNLLTAVYNGQAYLVKSRLKSGADPDIKDNRGYSVVLIAARLGYWQILVDLLQAGAYPDTIDNTGRSALHYAAFAGSIEAVQALLHARANTELLDKAGQTPGSLAADKTIQQILR